ncbi:glycosyltransferase family 1 protein [Deinococcus wulumuqiensis]|uniref:Glycosyltransferase family 1 protein n=1 Tax=Deinococcus wulumuqiensis TaxID=980427 RepID=A0A345IGX3_9DEIO|nr:glycosyltransferase family 4 protein [Deinococcus wulumuqiensis]AXG98945.1 glycosyltransferase family 1 protein [Deinococcus wulumuqiensis]
MTDAAPRGRGRDLTLAVITDAPRVAGSEVWLLDVLPRLLDSGQRATVYCSAAPALDRWAAQLMEKGVAVVRGTGPEALPGLTAGADLRVLQVWDPATYRTLMPRLKAPRSVVIHDQLDYHYGWPLQGTYRAIYRQTKGKHLSGAEQRLTVSRWGAAFLQRELQVPDVQAVPNGVDTDRFSPLPGPEREESRARLGFRRFTVLVPGRFAPEKNQLAAVWAARRTPDIDFVFVGDMDSGGGRLAQRLAQGREHIQFWGRRWDMPDLYRAADVLLQPTLAENQSLVTLEALASGLPIVTTPIPAQRELVQDGQTGLLVAPQPALLAQALRALAAHPAQARQLGAAGRAWVLEHHALARTVEQVARAFAKAARLGAGRA